MAGLCLFALLEAKRPILEARAKENLKTSTGGANPQPLMNSTKAEKINVRKDLAQEAGVSEFTYSKLHTINQKGSDELKEAKRPILEKQARERVIKGGEKGGSSKGMPNLADPIKQPPVRDQLAAEAGEREAEGGGKNRPCVKFDGTGKRAVSVTSLDRFS